MGFLLVEKDLCCTDRSLHILEISACDNQLYKPANPFITLLHYNLCLLSVNVDIS